MPVIDNEHEVILAARLLGSRGGSKRSRRKRRAVLMNLRLANEAKAALRRAAKKVIQP